MNEELPIICLEQFNSNSIYAELGYDCNIHKYFIDAYPLTKELSSEDKIQYFFTRFFANRRFKQLANLK